MATSPTDLIPVVQRSYDLCADLYPHIDRFPRAQRGLLGRVILEDALQTLTLVTIANRRSDKTERLSEASGRLDALRITLRLSHRLGFLSNGGYERLAGLADEVGRMLGGWIKYERAESMEGHASAWPWRRGSDTLQGNRGAAVATPSTDGDLLNAPAAPKRAGGVRYKLTSATVEKYLRAKLAHPESIVFVRVGAFCQTFFEDAAYCGRALRLMVRDRAAASEPEKILTCGIPFDRLDKYVALLQQAGRAVHVE